MARKKKKAAEMTAAADVAVADTVEATAKMDAVIETKKPKSEFKPVVTEGELTEKDTQILGALRATECWMTMAGDQEIKIFGPSLQQVKRAKAQVWRVLGRLRREKKIDKYPTINTEVVTK